MLESEWKTIDVEASRVNADRPWLDAPETPWERSEKHLNAGSAKVIRNRRALAKLEREGVDCAG